MKKQLILISSSIQRQFPSRIARAEQRITLWGEYNGAALVS